MTVTGYLYSKNPVFFLAKKQQQQGDGSRSHHFFQPAKPLVNEIAHRLVVHFHQCRNLRLREALVEPELDSLLLTGGQPGKGSFQQQPPRFLGFPFYNGLFNRPIGRRALEMIRLLRKDDGGPASFAGADEFEAKRLEQGEFYIIGGG